MRTVARRQLPRLAVMSEEIWGFHGFEKCPLQRANASLAGTSQPVWLVDNQILLIPLRVYLQTASASVAIASLSTEFGMPSAE